VHRIDTATKAVDLFGAGKHGFKAGDPSIPTPATHMSPDWCNDLQENVVRVIEDLGIALVKGDGTQLKAAIAQMITNAAFGIPPLPDHVGAAADGDELAIVVGGVHKRISVAELFTSRGGIDQYARDGLTEVAWQLAIDKATPAGLFASTGRLNVFASDNLVLKTGATYNGAAKTYGNPGTVTTASEAAKWTGRTGGFTFSGSSITSTADNDQIRIVDELSGDFEVSWTWYGGGNSGAGCSASLRPVADDAAFNQDSRAGGNNYWEVNRTASSTVLYNGTTTATIGEVIGHACKFRRTGSTIEFLIDGVVQHTFSQTYATNMRFTVGIGNAGAGLDFRFISWTIPGSAVAMTLRDTALVVPSAPLDGRFLFLHKFGGGGTLGTDITAHMSRDNAANFAVGSLTLLHPWAYDASWNVVAADFDLSALPTGVDVVPELRTAAVEQYVRAFHYNAE